MASLSIVLLGGLVADTVVRPLEALPPAGRLAEVQEISLRAGGCAINTATWLARLGVDVAVVGQVGKDALGDFLLGVLGSRRINHQGVRTDPDHPTSASVVLVDGTGERSFLHVPGAGGALPAGTIDKAWLFHGDALHIAGALALPALDGPPLAHLLHQAQDRRLYTSLDPVWDPSGRWDRVGASLAHLDLLFANMEEAAAISGCGHPGAAADWLRARGVREVALKLGAQGSYICGDEGSGTFGPIPVSPVDGTGAGDAFVAAYLFARRSGWPIPAAARFANAAGAFATTTVGASEVTIGLEELRDMASL
jgi:sugar/nucleoside kinase (ribokinase family)